MIKDELKRLLMLVLDEGSEDCDIPEQYRETIQSCMSDLWYMQDRYRQASWSRQREQIADHLIATNKLARWLCDPSNSGKGVRV